MAKEKLVLADMSVEEINAKLSALQSELMHMKFDHTVKGMGNPMELRSLRRDVARLHTDLRSRELQAMSAESLEMRSKIRARRRRQK